MTTTELRWVRLTDLHREPVEEVPRLVAAVLEDLATLRALMLIHGSEVGWRRYLEAGGRVRFGDDGAPRLPLPLPPGPLSATGTD